MPNMTKIGASKNYDSLHSFNGKFGSEEFPH